MHGGAGCALGTDVCHCTFKQSQHGQGQQDSPVMAPVPSENIWYYEQPSSFI